MKSSRLTDRHIGIRESYSAVGLGELQIALKLQKCCYIKWVLMQLSLELDVSLPTFTTFRWCYDTFANSSLRQRSSNLNAGRYSCFMTYSPPLSRDANNTGILDLLLMSIVESGFSRYPYLDIFLYI